MSEFKKHNIYKIGKDTEDVKKIQKILDQYMDDIDLLVDGILVEHIYNNGVPEKIKKKIDTIKKDGKDKLKL